MNYSVSFDEFVRLAHDHNVIPIFGEIVADHVTAVSAYETLSQKQPYAYLLESIEGGERLGRYSFVGRAPHQIYTVEDGRVTLLEGKKKKTWVSQNPLQDLKTYFSSIRMPPLPGLPRFSGGAVGFWDYDTVRYFERLKPAKRNALGVPQAVMMLTGDLIAFDHVAQIAKLIAHAWIPTGATSKPALKKLYVQTLKRIDTMARVLQNPSRSPRPSPSTKKITITPLTTKQQYTNAVEKAKEHIRAGDIIQVVLSQRWVLNQTAPSFQVYRALRLLNPSPYMYYLKFPTFEIVGSSPEILVRKEETLAETRPIAGTRPRGKSAEQDVQNENDLKNDPKERAEHLMLVDLGRNDLGRVCEPGTVKVPELMVLERYSHVMHLVSSVTGRLKPTANAFDLFQACFPAGTVSGAPKVRAMQIIDELEPLRRGPYAGATGYFSFTGNMDMAITIRTMVFKSGKIYLQAGAGIVADSVPEKEYEESEHKSAALVAAIRKARDLT